MKILAVVALGLSTVTVACTDDSATARVQSGGSSSSPQGSASSSLVPAKSPTPLAPIAWYAEPKVVAPAVGPRLEEILRSLRTEAVVALVTVTDVRLVSGTISGMQLTDGTATLRVDEFWKRSSTEPESVAVGFTYPASVWHKDTAQDGQKRRANGILLQVGDQLVVSGRGITTSVFPEYAKAVGVIAPSAPGQQGMLIRGDVAIEIIDGVSVPIETLKAAARGEAPSAATRDALRQSSSSSSSLVHLPN